MTNLGLLKRYIEYSGIKLSVIAYKIGVSRTTLWSRLNGKSEFTNQEVKDICKVLRLNEKEREKVFYTEHSSIQKRKVGG